MYQAKHPAAFINNIADEGTKAEAIEWLQRTWDELQALRADQHCPRTAFVQGETKRCVLERDHVGSHKVERRDTTPYCWHT